MKVYNYKLWRYRSTNRRLTLTGKLNVIVKTLLPLSFFFTIILSFISCSQEQQPTPKPEPYQLLNGPAGIISDNVGTIYFTDVVNLHILSITTAGVIQPFVNINMQNGCSSDGGLCFFAALSGPQAIAIDNTGNIYFADGYCIKVYKIDPSTHIMTHIAGNGSDKYSGDGDKAINAGFGGIGSMLDIAVDTKGNMYVTANDSRIRKIVLSSGIITTFAGNGVVGFGGDNGPATSAQLHYNNYIAVDDTGNLYISDGGNYRIRKVNYVTNIINTIAGTGTSGYNGNNIPASSAQLVSPSGIKVDSGGNICFCDGTRIREIRAKTNLIYNVGGNGISGSSGDGGPATNAEMSPHAIAFDPEWNIYFINGTPSIRKINMSTGLITTVLHN